MRQKKTKRIEALSSDTSSIETRRTVLHKKMRPTKF